MKKSRLNLLNKQHEEYLKDLMNIMNNIKIDKELLKIPDSLKVLHSRFNYYIKINKYLFSFFYII